MRTFIAVDLPADVRTRLAALVHRLKFQAPAGISWTRIDDLHITLKFLGGIEDSGLSAVTDTVRAVAAGTSSFPLSVSGTGTFPPGSRRARVLWIGLKDCPALLALQAEIEHTLETLGHPREDRPFHPHLTIGRVKASSVPQALLDRLAEYKDASFGDLVVREVVVYRSILRPGGPEHIPLFKGDLRT